MNPIGLAAQVVRDLAPADIVRAANHAGFDMVGLPIKLDAWTAATTADVRGALADTSMVVIDAEVIRIGQASEADFLRQIDIAAEIGARHLIVVSFVNAAATVVSLARICRHAATVGVRPVLEFGAFTRVATVQQAAAIAAAADPDCGVLVDTLHLARSGGAPADIAVLPAWLLPYYQICDAGLPPATIDRDTLLHEARYARVELGYGQLSPGSALDAMPVGIPLSVEVLSQAMFDRFPDPFTRAAALAASTRAWLGSRQPKEP